MTTPEEQAPPPAEPEQAEVLMEAAPDTSWVSMVEIAKRDGSGEEGE